MRVLYALICEEASAGQDGRLDVTGIFHQLHAPGFPAQQERLVLALALEWDRGEEGSLEFHVDLVSPEDQRLLSIDADTEIEPAAPGEAPPQTRLVIPIERIVFPEEGAYEFKLRALKEEFGLAPLHLIEKRVQQQE